VLFGLTQVPSTAFGDGSHPTTQACARVVDYLCRARAPRSVLDVGTGTGILARIARQRGAAFIVGTDIDPEALEVARRNVALDAHPTPIELSAAPPDSWGARFDLVVANILEAPLVALAPALLAALAPRGALVLSGFLPPQVPALRLAFGEMTETRHEGWSVLVRDPFPAR
jgi:ribosomal protein L11 methyltransferase